MENFSLPFSLSSVTAIVFRTQNAEDFLIKQLETIAFLSIPRFFNKRRDDEKQKAVGKVIAKEVYPIE